MPLTLKAPLSPAPPRKAVQETRQRRRLSKPLPKSSTTLVLHTALRVSVVDEPQELDGVELRELDGVGLRELDGVGLQELDGVELQELDGVELQELDGVELVLDNSARKVAYAKNLSVLLEAQLPQRPRRITWNGAQEPFARRRALPQNAVSTNFAYSSPQKVTHNVLTSSESLSPDIPTTLHRPSFTPGVAARPVREVQSQHTVQRNISQVNQDDCYRPNCSDESPSTRLEALEAEEIWIAPLPIARTETPVKLDYTHLGGLRLASLSITNGKASPHSSVLSKNVMRNSVPFSQSEASSNYDDDGRQRYSFGSVDEQPPKIETPPFSSNSIRLPKRWSLQYSSPQMANATGVEKPTLGAGAIHQSRVPYPANRTSIIAQEYMAELSENPFQIQRTSSITGSVLICMSKATEFDDQLFESDDENEDCNERPRVDTSSPDGSDYVTLNLHYTTNDAASSHEEAFHSSLQLPYKQSSRPSLKPVGSNPSLDKSGNARHSYISSKTSYLEVCLRVGCDGANDKPDSTAAAPAAPVPEKPRRSIFRLSIPPLFARLFQSRASKPAIPSASRKSPSTKPRKLKKPRPLSRHPPLGHIAVQVHPEIQQDDIPPILPDASAKLAVRKRASPRVGTH